ncbi:hypothetical protein K438DRAFT_1972323 [Mycena galopus ATCC 62051]|nr:hypothetical protein K438DRAFT_1972323 [Mycena galopus ATCC 62051]
MAIVGVEPKTLFLGSGSRFARTGPQELGLVRNHFPRSGPGGWRRTKARIKFPRSGAGRVTQRIFRGAGRGRERVKYTRPCSMIVLPLSRPVPPAASRPPVKSRRTSRVTPAPLRPPVTYHMIVGLHHNTLSSRSPLFADDAAVSSGQDYTQ